MREKSNKTHKDNLSNCTSVSYVFIRIHSQIFDAVEGQQSVDAKENNIQDWNSENEHAQSDTDQYPDHDRRGAPGV